MIAATMRLLLTLCWCHSKQGFLVHSEPGSDGVRLPLPTLSPQPQPTTDEAYADYVAKLRDDYEGVTDCEFEGLRLETGAGRSVVGPEQVWVLGTDGTIRGTGSEGEVCVTAANVGDVKLQPCAARCVISFALSQP